MSGTLINLGMKVVGLILFLICLGAGALFTYGALKIPGPPSALESSSPAPAWPEPVAMEQLDWTVFQKPSGTTTTQQSPLARLYRLAGTFFAFGAGTEEAPGQRTAVIDDLQQHQQFLVKEGDLVKEFQVVRIFPDRVVLRNQGFDQELWLSYSGGPEKKKPESGQAGSPQVATTEPQVLETNRFGKRVGQTRWVFGREALMDYYNEMLDNPERMAALFLSLKADYQGESVAGYRLDVEGEGEFFKDIGLSPGDVIRKVNSMSMVSPSRAEFLIGEFVKGRLSAVVMDIERQGQPEKLIYLIR